MDPITTAIVAAIAAGVISGVTEVSKKTMVDAYSTLKSAIKRKFGDDSNIFQAIANLEKEPNLKPNQDALASQFAQVKASDDSELQNLAQALLEALKSTPEGKETVSKYQIDVSDSQVGVIGNETEVKGGIHFGGAKQ